MLNRVVTICIFSTLFFSSYVLFKEPFEFYLPYLFIVLLFPFLVIKNKFPTKILGLFGVLLVSGMVSVFLKENTYGLFFKIFLNLFISILFYYYVFQSYKLDVNKLFSYYMMGALIVCVIGIIQFVSFNIGFEYGYNFNLYGLNKWGVIKGGLFGIRVNSIFSEPSYFGAAIGPAFFISLYNLITRNTCFIGRKQSILILIAYFLTSSTVSYMGFFISLVLILVNMGLVRYALIVTPVLVFSYFYVYNNVDDFKLRVDGINELFQGGVKSGYDVHGSSYVQYNNFHVASENFKRHPFFGTGLGSHQIAYKKYSLDKAFGVIDDFNSTDGNSMLYRMISETGLFGVLFILIFIIKFFVFRKQDEDDKSLGLISSACLVVIFLQLLRQGNYTYNGFMFYMWLYYYTKQVAMNKHEEILPELKNEELSLSGQSNI